MTPTTPRCRSCSPASGRWRNGAARWKMTSGRDQAMASCGAKKVGARAVMPAEGSECDRRRTLQPALQSGDWRPMSR